MPTDLAPAAQPLAALVAAVEDAHLDLPTPCGGWVVRDLLEHLAGVPAAFAGAARKQPVPVGEPQPLGPGWKARLAADLDELVVAWRDPEAWTGMTQVGGVDVPGEVCGLIGLDELVVHGWDLSRSTGLPWSVDEATLAAVEAFVASFEVPDGAGDGPFGPPVPVPAGASTLARLLGGTGRDPGWSPTR